MNSIGYKVLAFRILLNILEYTIKFYKVNIDINIVVQKEQIKLKRR